jgi:hypothetical protein
MKFHHVHLRTGSTTTLRDILGDDRGNVSNVMTFLLSIGVDKSPTPPFSSSLSRYVFSVVLRFLQAHIQLVLSRFVIIIFTAVSIELFAKCETLYNLF